VVTTLITFFMVESYAPAILERKTKRLRKQLGREDLRSKLTLQITKAQLMKRSLVRPIKLLTRSPVVLLFSLYVATIYGMLCKPLGKWFMHPKRTNIIQILALLQYLPFLKILMVGLSS
jgi:hypothetical protein